MAPPSSNKPAIERRGGHTQGHELCLSILDYSEYVCVSGMNQVSMACNIDHLHTSGTTYVQNVLLGRMSHTEVPVWPLYV